MLYPAIDLRQGWCVRLRQGDPGQMTRYHEDPVTWAKELSDLGFRWLHIVDLDGALQGRGENRDVVLAIRKETSLRLQLGGGIRTRNDIEFWLHAGIDRIILGTVAVRDFPVLVSACEAYPGRIALGLDTRNNQVAVSGWTELVGNEPLDLAQRSSEAGVCAIIHTSIERDGMLKGLDLDASASIASSVSAPVIVSGGLASLTDIEDVLSHTNPRLGGVILGRALYDGRIDPASALEIWRRHSGRSDDTP